MNTPQPGILLPLPPLARFLSFALLPGASARAGLEVVRAHVDGEHTVVGLGLSLVSALNAQIDGLRIFPRHAQHGLDIPFFHPMPRVQHRKIVLHRLK